MVLIAGSIDPNAPPNLPPEWTNQPNPSFTALTAGTYDFSNNTTDADGDTLTYSLNASSTALPSGFTLGTDGILTADGTQTSGDTSGIIVDVSDGVNAAVSSSAFSISVGVTGALSWPTQDITSFWSTNTPAVRNRNAVGDGVAAGRGFGMHTRHAYTTVSSPTIYHVTTLAENDAGSLKRGLEDFDGDGARIIVFDVAGKFVIDDQITVAGEVWVAGQTAPGPVWIELTDIGSFGRPIRITESNVFFQHCHIWCNTGDLTVQTNCVIFGAAGSSPTNAVFDHCFIGGATDQCFDVLGGTNLTLIDCIVAYPQGKDVQATGHTVGETNHAYGGLWEQENCDVSIIGNLWAFCYRRNPLMRYVHGTICNFITYGSDGDQIAFQGRDSTGAVTIDFNIVGYRSINDSGTGPIWIYSDSVSSSTYTLNTNSQIYLNDNTGRGYTSDEWDIVNDSDNQEADIRSDIRVDAAWPSGLVAAANRSNTEADYITLVTKNAGPRPNDRLPFVQGVIDHVVNGTGSQQNTYTSPTISSSSSTWTFSGNDGEEHNPGLNDSNRTQIEEQLLSESEGLLN